MKHTVMKDTVMKDTVNPASLALIADIGGTNARFALTDLSALNAQVLDARSLDASAFASLQHAAEHYLSAVGVQPRRAAIAVASPVNGEEIRLTNRAWSFTRSELQRALGLDHLHVLNDFGAVAWSVPALSEAETITVHGSDDAPLQGPVSVLGPGTGLGVAMLIDEDVSNQGRRWQVVETEGGHVSFAPLGEEELAIARWFTARFGRVSNERLLCGSGLSHIDAVLRGAVDHVTGQHQDLREPADIVAAALEGHDLAARRTLARFCAVLGSVAGDAALIHGARTVMLAGGIVPRFVPFLRSSAFRERFLAKGRFAPYLETVTIRVITHSSPGLLGAAMSLRASAQHAHISSETIR
jgi:glucokinase